MTETITRTEIVPLRLLIDGRWVEGTGRRLESTSPANPENVIAAGGTATGRDVQAAMAAARTAAAEWAATPMAERGGYLSRAAAIITANADVWGTELAREEGKTFAEGRGEVLRAAQILTYYSAESDRMAGEVFSSPRRGEKILVTRKPLGVVAVITPFNFPIAIPAWKIAPALVFGNTVVWKPASSVPLLALRLAQALVEAGLPAGVLNLVIGPGSLGNEIVNHPDLDGLTFTGSTGVGRMLAAAAAGAGVPIQAEMGGKNASVVLDDADLELATEQVLFGAFRSTGQKCTATSRLVLQDSIADAFLERLAERLAEWQTGDPTDSSVHMGPVVSDSAAADIRAGIAAAVAQGAIPRFAGDVSGLGPAFVAPTVLEIPEGGQNIAWRDEFFGPVLAVRRAATTAEAFALANDSEFGLSCAVFTQDLTKALDAMESIDVGILHVNSESAGADPHVPFGGAKKSGYGPKEQGGAAREFFTHTTTVYLRGA
ncbi:aldehyde dehydrogenase family protein [Paeniglutamicibacter kerguelensis]|uniref:Aldehyde dehydrogenase (NAD+) n=1 Tax=Paeniglutamicibacter kerguelensis TaxID=254788 RepID=A0ABS4X8A1_9MICC|nr:aldehyde dehydrogenase (NAD+) [Paeniglutamicibacter kerguelensis]